MPPLKLVLENIIKLDWIIQIMFSIIKTIHQDKSKRAGSSILLTFSTKQKNTLGV